MKDDKDHFEGVILDVTPADGDFDRRFLEKIGHPVLMCHGPEHDVCPLLVDDECEKLNAAHGIIFQLDLDRPKHRTILKCYQDVVAEDKPIVAVVRKGQKAKYRDLLAGVQVWESEPTAAELDGLAATVEAADWSRE